MSLEELSIGEMAGSLFFPPSFNETGKIPHLLKTASLLEIFGDGLNREDRVGEMFFLRFSTDASSVGTLGREACAALLLA